jgi:hypothetical protein
MRKVIPMESKAVSAEAREDARLRVFAVFECLAVLAPKANIPERKRLADRILRICAGVEKRMTPDLLRELIAIHSQCVLDQQGKCALTVFAKPLCWEINQAMGVGNDEDKGFRRVDEMCAAKPLGKGRFKGE